MGLIKSIRKIMSKPDGDVSEASPLSGTSSDNLTFIEACARTAKLTAQSVLAKMGSGNYIRYTHPRIQSIRVSFTNCNNDFILASREILASEETVYWSTPIHGSSGVYEKSINDKCVEYIKIFSGGNAGNGTSMTITDITLIMIRPDRAEPEEYSFTPTQSMVKSDKADISCVDGTCRIECSGPYQGAYIYIPDMVSISHEELKNAPVGIHRFTTVTCSYGVSSAPPYAPLPLPYGINVNNINNYNISYRFWTYVNQKYTELIQYNGSTGNCIITAQLKDGHVCLTPMGISISTGQLVWVEATVTEK